MAVVDTRQYTADELLAMRDGVRFELVDGQLVERNGGAFSSWVGGILYHFLISHCLQKDLGWVWHADNGYQCFPGHPNKVRKPDVSYIRRGRLRDEQLPEGFVTIPPDLAVEVISPNDLAYEVDEKVMEYIEAGVRLIWIVNPEARTVRVHRADGSIGWLKANEELNGEDVVPGFRCRVNDFLPPVAGRPD